jgi:large subunit ribosomal protein L29
MKSKDLKKKEVDDLKKELEETRRNLSNSRSGMSGSKARNVKEVREIKKDIARILTEINSRKS